MCQAFLAETVETVAYSLIAVVSLAGNFLIVLIVYKTRTLKKPVNMLIANMAISDLLYPIFSVLVRACLHGGGGTQVGEVTRFNGWGNPPVHIISPFNLITFT